MAINRPQDYAGKFESKPGTFSLLAGDCQRILELSPQRVALLISGQSATGYLLANNTIGAGNEGLFIGSQDVQRLLFHDIGATVGSEWYAKDLGAGMQLNWLEILYYPER